MYRGKWGKAMGHKEVAVAWILIIGFFPGSYEGPCEQPVQLLSFLEDAHSRIGSVGAGRPGSVRYIHLQDPGQQRWQNDGTSNWSRTGEKPRRRCPPWVQHLQLLESSHCQHPLLRIGLALSPRPLSSTTLPSLPDLKTPFLPPFSPINLTVSPLLCWGGADESAWVCFMYVFIYLFILPIFPQKSSSHKVKGSSNGVLGHRDSSFPSPDIKSSKKTGEGTIELYSSVKWRTDF